MEIYVGRWNLLPEDWEGINGLYEKSEDEIRAEVSREADVDQEQNPHDPDNLIAVYSLAEFEETFNADEGTFNGKRYWVKFFDNGKSVLED